MNKTIVALAAVTLCLAAYVFGCSEPNPLPNPATPFAASASELDKIKEALIKKGIKNPPAAVFDMDDDRWVVVVTPDGVGPNGEPPPGKPIPLRVLVTKSTFEVTKQGDPSSKTGAREL